jgi:hypothetical protein
LANKLKPWISGYRPIGRERRKPLVVGRRIRFLRAVAEAGLASVDTDLGKRTIHSVTLSGKSTQN